MEDIIRIDVPTFIRLLELAREDIKSDPPIHFIAEIVTAISQRRAVTMNDYDTIIANMSEQPEEPAQKKPDELDDIKRLGGLTK